MRILYATPRRRIVLAAFALVLLLVSGWVALQLYSWSRSNSTPYIYRWFADASNRPALMTVRTEPCPGAPFLLPSSGFIGLLYADPAAPYNLLGRHTGVDIFGDGAPGQVPIVAAYDGYLSRLPTWRSTVIIRHEDPLQPGRTIWTYYTHMASRDGSVSFIEAAFPRGTSDVFVAQGQVIGYQGDYGGNRSVGLHLHFSIVTGDSEGNFLNEAVLGNTLDPSPYLGMELGANTLPARPIDCDET
jgi:peptidoglycan LD-endopeptidase LytH